MKGNQQNNQSNHDNQTSHGNGSGQSQNNQ